MTDSKAPSPYTGDYEWPSNLYTEMSDMARLSFLVYDFAYVVDACRDAKKDGKEFVGLDVDFEANKSVTKAGVADAALSRSFTPGEIKKLIEDNISILQKYDSTFKGKSLDGIYKSLDEMQGRADASGIDRSLVLEEFDDFYQTRECVYGVTRDSSNKRITIVFRGTENKLAFGSNWRSNASINHKEVEIPEVLKGKIDGDELKFHTGFHNYLFNESVDSDDAAGTTRFDQIMDDLKSLLAKYPDYKIFVTGHSLGAAVSSVAAFYFACDDDLPKPISCINFASPRVGGWEVFQGVQHLEQTKKLRVLRIVNENDLVTTIPSLGYWHSGWQINTYKPGWFNKNPKPDIEYLSPLDSAWKRFGKTWTNSIVSNLNLGYDHSDYISRIELAENYLEETTGLNAVVYMDEKHLGYKLGGDEE